MFPAAGFGAGNPFAVRKDDEMVQGDAMATSLVETWAMTLTGLFNPPLAQFTRPQPPRLSLRHLYRGPTKYKHVMNLAMGILLNLEHAAEVAFSTRPLTTLTGALLASSFLVFFEFALIFEFCEDSFQGCSHLRWTHRESTRLRKELGCMKNYHTKGRVLDMQDINSQ